MAHMMQTYHPLPVIFERGEGAYLFDAGGRRYLDFAAGIATSALGHGHPKLRQALFEQGAKLWHLSNFFTIPGQEQLAARLCSVSFAERAFFTNSGAEAVECGIKTMRKYFSHTGQPERWRIITFVNAFHGRTLADCAASGQAKMLQGFGPPMPGFDHVPFGDIDAVAAAIGNETAGILIEPIQGEGGINAASLDFLRQLRQLADRHGLLLFFDEIQCGLGRTGKLFAHEWAGVTPDVMALAKGLGSGFPLGACLATERAAGGMTYGTHGSTGGGNPLAMAIGQAVLEVLLAPGFLAEVERVAGLLRPGLERLVQSQPEVFSAVRGTGLMLGLVCRPANLQVVERLLANGLVTVPAGQNVIRLLPPLIIGDAEVALALDVLQQTGLEFRAVAA